MGPHPILPRTGHCFVLTHSILNITYTGTGTVIHVPFQSLDTFILYNVFPFPTSLNNMSYILNLPHTIPLVSLNLKHIALPDSDDSDSCFLLTYHTQISSASRFVFVLSKLHTCLLNLLQNSPVEPVCPLVKAKTPLIQL